IVKQVLVHQRHTKSVERLVEPVKMLFHAENLNAAVLLAKGFHPLKYRLPVVETQRERAQCKWLKLFNPGILPGSVTELGDENVIGRLFTKFDPIEVELLQGRTPRFFFKGFHGYVY